MDKEDRQEIKRIEAIIKKELLSEYDFIRRGKREEEVAPNINFNDPASRRSIHETPCVLWRWFKLSDCRAWADVSEALDSLILKALDNLAKGGEVRFLSVEFKESMRFGDAGFHVELGCGTSDFAITDIFKKVTRLYAENPLKPNERKGTLLDISGAVRSLQERQLKHLEERLGISKKADPTLESRLHREDLEAETQYKSAVIKLAQSMGKDEKEV